MVEKAWTLDNMKQKDLKIGYMVCVSSTHDFLEVYNQNGLWIFASDFDGYKDSLITDYIKTHRMPRDIGESTQEYNALKNTLDHCCWALQDALREDTCPIDYDAKFRVYRIKDTQGDCAMIMTYCPHCARKFPTDLRNAWYEILTSEHAIQDALDTYKEKAPKEFHTDEWWKKRGL